MKKEFYIGIDIGKNGAIMILASEPYLKAISPIAMPMINKELDLQSLYKALEVYKGSQCHVIFEKLGVIYGSSKTTAFSMGYQAGAIEAICISLQLPYTIVHAKVWQKEMFQGIKELTKTNGKTRDTKAMALIAAKRLFPDLELSFKKGLKPHDGLIDALLIAEYGKRNF